MQPAFSQMYEYLSFFFSPGVPGRKKSGIFVESGIFYYRNCRKNRIYRFKLLFQGILKGERLQSGKIQKTQCGSRKIILRYKRQKEGKMNKKKFDSNLYILAGILFLVAGLVQNMMTFYVIGCAMFVLAYANKKN